MSNIDLEEERKEDFRKFMEASCQQISKKLQDQLDTFAQDINAYYAPHIDTDAWTNYREFLKKELEGDYYLSVTNDETGRWAQKCRKMIFEQYKDELIDMLNKDQQREIEELKKQLKEAYTRRF